MNYEDAVKAFQSFSKKHPIDDDYDMNTLIINQVKNLLDDKNFFDNKPTQKLPEIPQPELRARHR